MIKRFFHKLNSLNVHYLLISGQAAVLYGAATFSEDVDIWVKPEANNWNRFLRLLRSLKARIYKLTPPISMELIRRGHGYHFQLPSGEKEIPFWFLDVMGIVPRISDFNSAFENATYQESEWGRISVVGIRELVEIKKTRRLEDYPVISNLVKIEYNNLYPSISSQDWEWILNNTFEIEDIIYYLSKHRKARAIASSSARECLSLIIKTLVEKREKELYIKEASQQIALEIEKLRQEDRVYWQPIIEELGQLKRKKLLLLEDSALPSFIP